MKRKLAVWAFSCVLGVVSVTQAGVLSATSFVIEAQNEDGVGTFEVSSEDGVWNGDTYRWMLSGPIDIMDGAGENSIATLESATVSYVADPVVSLGFAASTFGSATTFTITSANLSFPAIAAPEARASAGITVTSTSASGSTLTGQFAGESYRAYYNDPGNIPGTGSTFATLVGGFSAPGFSTTTASGEYPLGGLFSTTDQASVALPAITSMSSQFSFNVSADSMVSGSSTFVVVPEPSASLLCLIGLAAIALVRRRQLGN